MKQRGLTLVAVLIVAATPVAAQRAGSLELDGFGTWTKFDTTLQFKGRFGAGWDPAAAQAPASPTPAVSMTVSASGNSLAPTLAAARLGFSPDEAQLQTVNASAARVTKREGRALALVGGAAVIAGLLISDEVDAGTVIAIGGLGLGLYGLYVWLR